MAAGLGRPIGSQLILATAASNVDATRGVRCALPWIRATLIHTQLKRLVATCSRQSTRTVVDSMNKRLISRLMHQRVSQLRSSGVYFFRGDFEHVLRGVVLDYTPRGLYIEDFRFPLFDFAGPNLLYSNRLTEGAYIEKGAMSESAIVDFIMTRPEILSDFGEVEPVGLQQFVEHLRSAALLNPHAQLIQAATLILLDEYSQATKLLDEAPLNLHPSDVPRWKQLRDCLKQGPGTARALLHKVRQENLAAFGVLSSS